MDDCRFLLTPANSDQCGRFWTEGADDAPTHVVVGSRSTDEKLRRLAQRVPYTFDELAAFRDAQVAGHH